MTTPALESIAELLKPEERRELVRLLHEREQRDGYKYSRWFPDEGEFRRELYPKHIAFFHAGSRYKERLFMAANRVGKSEAGAYEVTCHMTGVYPPWWTGKRFTHATDWWGCGTTGETVQNIVQQKLFGAWTTDTPIGPGGMVPRHLIVDYARKPHGRQGSLDTVWVRHISGQVSTISLKAYEQGRKAFEGTEKHGIWCDEEPPEDCYTEMVFRTATTRGIVLVTFTPLQGMSNVVAGFLQPDNEDAREFKFVINAGWADVPHIPVEEQRMLLATCPPFLRDARTKGLPQLGAGAIYQIPETELTVKPFEIPEGWKRCWGADVGGGSGPTAVVWLTEDPQSRTVFLYDVYKRATPEPAVHIAAVTARGVWIPGVGDCAALIHTAHDAEQVITTWRRGGLDLQLPDKAVESGIQDVWMLMSSGRFKVFNHCEEWFKEYRMYHRDEKGRIVKKDDHALDATRYGVRSGLKRAKNYAEWRLEHPEASGFFHLPRPNPYESGGGGGQGWMGR